MDTMSPYLPCPMKNYPLSFCMRENSSLPPPLRSTLAMEELVDELDGQNTITILEP